MWVYLAWVIRSPPSHVTLSFPASLSCPSVTHQIICQTQLMKNWLVCIRITLVGLVFVLLSKVFKYAIQFYRCNPLQHCLEIFGWLLKISLSLLCTFILLLLVDGMLSSLKGHLFIALTNQKYLKEIHGTQLWASPLRRSRNGCGETVNCTVTAEFTPELFILLLFADLILLDKSLACLPPPSKIL